MARPVLKLLEFLWHGEFVKHAPPIQWSALKYLHSSIIGGLLCACTAVSRPLQNVHAVSSNYINDAGPHQDYHILLPTQLFFDVTDVLPGLALYTLLQDRKTLPSGWLLLASLIVSATHLVLSIWDQGFIHLLTMKGAVIRDAMFIVSDLAGLFGVGWYLHGGIRKSGRALGIGTGILLVCYLALKRIAGYR
jgi:hypothetical protein